MLRTIKVRTTPGSGRTSARAAFCLRPNLGNMPSMPPILPSTGGGCLFQHAAIFWPVRGEVRGALTKPVADRDQHRDEG